ncbi:tRNA (adenosine(37)-N6)-threonylcarbamoyltransferase complex transferase subunit TsaD [Ethanoligenens harbinense]|uniref:tRNA N6-adenosine threonylcarbamoyltransferase n=1 Tax=Ethanoligenens harbinense (strain DSM 18485 / JCM 12961 / CGMCC 1.5033 / YUAN-3) TaxID=663278 RepID=E6U760_ETHHY|nr:tRNA (adenosine(37)-N6)-threonylcarbamoyltransferase complex transferase subunit TsaD [Ethanoligenens harbinense]ADU28130.1 metalloendopeptidase, glycoprotease family [Ethanoligenens harbinense YUAN-3]AVQ97136.1 tRNA (adenosine(37)-N6)-threonylcarbamoyltransferase complex transferase subunit TsaD [Ethanoligenens harbinense YUAN-3]AYF39799.1 tRNA (adenosine(37)-N6)-threonylcarbamoyltransferase complex transferase subunit TsaD [Ethanoligenens harbinense]AYF42631.1 tRNA (adenosine(37)-N6)-threo
MNILAFESSCDETAAAVVRDGREVLSSVIASQVETHRLYGGVVPEIASRQHVEVIAQLCAQALEEAGCTLDAIDAVAVTYAPGLIGALLVGVNFAKGLALARGLPLIPVHHLRGHIAANYLAHPNLTPPFLCLVASGGHSHIVQADDYTHFTVLGRTRDDAAGEAFDKAARALGFPYPGGVAIDRAAQSGNPDAIRFPRPQVNGAPYDYSFSGLKTAVLNYVHNAAQKGEAICKEDVAASFQAAVVDMLAHGFLLAAADTASTTLVLAGGVVANTALRRRIENDCAASGRRLYLPPLALCGDNAAMIGAQAYYEYQAGHTAGADLNACANMEIG